jgi:uncharacterized protein (DUF2126 family)/transglutaminase-like putative cysteine protease
VRVLITHSSRYQFDGPTKFGPHLIRLRPADHAAAKIESYRLLIDIEHRLHWQRDPHGNHLARVTFPRDTTPHELPIVVELTADISPRNPFDFFVDDRARQVPFVYPDGLHDELDPFLRDHPSYDQGPLCEAFFSTLPSKGDIVEVLVECTRLVAQRVVYVIRNEAGVWTPEQTLEHGRGSCRDSATLLIAALRSRGIATRFASGYLVQLADEGMIPDEPRGVSSDVVDLHAWVEAYVPGAGWIGLDATSGLFAGEGHIPLACTAVPGSAAPVDGSADRVATSLQFETTVTRLGFEPRVTAPIDEHSWHSLLAAGDAADAILLAQGLTVTVGGEPTFNARVNGDLPEWRGEALGPAKWIKGLQLAELLQTRLAPASVLLHRIGKHYPGESMPRWALDICARRDGVELWPQRKLPTLATADAARLLAQAICVQLGIADVQPRGHEAFEDPWPLLQTEHALPPNADPRRYDLDDDETRRRLAAHFDRGWSTPAGYAIPLARRDDRQGWLSETWSLRREQLFLLAGDGPMGMRLPLNSIQGSALVPLWPQWIDEPQFADPRRDDDQSQRIASSKSPRPVSIGIRTALCVQARGDTLWVFVPPVPGFDDFIALIAAIDGARTEVGFDFRLEGYPPPPSSNLQRFAVTPDPGVLEVNLPPVDSCRSSAALLDTVFDAALRIELHSEKYLLDGRVAGSGGGNHITIGGPTPETSPFFVRPDLLASLVAFAQLHPSLSYMFTGLFVGPTSQAPRLDETRPSAVDDLALALPRVLRQAPPPWMIDGIFRHLLVDPTGSTHRAEISIDKLCDPNTSFGRQGLVELRAFEMPPHPRMISAQVVLVRALLASFAKAPITTPVVHWGAELHDRFLLPHWLWADFERVLAHIRQHNIAIPAAAYKPFIELRCPVIGQLHGDGVTIDVRNAIEPWAVLGEEAGASGTVRYVDSSMERIEIVAKDFDPTRHLIAVGGLSGGDGIALPMHRGAEPGLFVGGVKFRAWNPPHAMHPHFGVHHPLRIELIDRLSERGLAAAAYHVWHPEGRAFEAEPLTRTEASARRAQRFTHEGPSLWPARARTISTSHAPRFTLDLRLADVDGTPVELARWGEVVTG